MKKTRCICQICTCGRHRCPHKPITAKKTPLKDCLITEYQTSYKQNEGFQPPQPVKPMEMSRPQTSPMDLTTTNRVDYKVYNVQLPPPKNQVTFETPQGPLYLESTYRNVYTAKSITKEKSYKTRSEYIVPAAKFNGSTVNRDSFKTWSVAPRKAIKPDYDKTCALIVFDNDDGRSDGKSTAQVDFPKYAVARPVIVKPVISSYQSGGEFDSNTIHRLCYTAKQVPIFRHKVAEKYKPHAGEMESLTTHKQDFIQHRCSPVTTCKPPEKSHISDEKSHYTTTNRETFKAWDVRRPMYMDQMEQYKIPDKPMEFNTVSRSTYVHHENFEKRSANKPQPVAVSSDNRQPFQGLTTSRSAYQPWETSRPQPNREQRIYAPPQDKFNGESTHRACFQGQFVPPAASSKPKETYVKAEGDMYLMSSYRDNYKNNEIPYCPAVPLLSNRLPSNQPNFKYSHKNQGGHKFYRMTIENKDTTMTVDIPNQPSTITVSVPS
ncbi:Stabilizer of axonemal microtubules 2 [Trichoplax sp. H2]|nr:Stabilizer of axonemal microtubules 2 [Trichoplax sp. H2]|eukprot:RDD42370.1 Stabilizer of axonemal microtubules 2 [Trichoplax sp. H2]